jgi:hypothetical protein
MRVFCYEISVFHGSENEVYFLLVCDVVYAWYKFGTRGSLVGWDIMLQAGKLRGSIPDEIIAFFQLT